jgi:hypothetical protein
MLKIPQLVRVQGVFFKKFYPVCVESYSLATNRYPSSFGPVVIIKTEPGLSPNQVRKLAGREASGSGMDDPQTRPP